MAQSPLAGHWHSAPLQTQSPAHSDSPQPAGAMAPSRAAKKKSLTLFMVAFGAQMRLDEQSIESGSQ